MEVGDINEDADKLHEADVHASSIVDARDLKILIAW